MGSFHSPPAEISNGAAAQMALPASTALVKFSVEYDKTEPGQALFVTGEHVLLGKWKPSLALRLSTSRADFPLWCSDLIPLPAGEALEFKFLLQDGEGGAEEWEPMRDNHRVLPAAGKIGLAKPTWASPGEVPLEEVPLKKALADGPSNLSRFIKAQESKSSYAKAYLEMSAGRKRGCWIWWVFPQFLDPERLSENNRLFRISSRGEAAAYLAHPLLGARYRDCVQLLLAALRKGGSIEAILGWSVDAKKFHQSVTVFRRAAEAGGLQALEEELREVLDLVKKRPYEGWRDWEDAMMKRLWEEGSPGRF